MLDLTINVINVHSDIFLPGTLPSMTEFVKRTREGRVLSIVSQSKMMGISVRFWEGVTSEKFRYENISKAHKQIVAYAKNSNQKMVCIAEDDAVFTCKRAWSYFLENIPGSFDVYFGGIYSAQISDGRITNGFSGMTLYIVHERFYDFFLSIKESDHIDRQLGNFAFEKEYKLCQPFIVKQMGGYSDNHRKILTYETFEQNYIYLTD